MTNLAALITDVDSVYNSAQALERFPCPKCSKPWSLSPGRIKAGHSTKSGSSYSLCLQCQDPRRRAVPVRNSKAEEEIRYPVRYTLDDNESAAMRYVIDLHTNERINEAEAVLWAKTKAWTLNYLWIEKLKNQTASNALLPSGKRVKFSEPQAAGSLIEIHRQDVSQVQVYQLASEPDNEGDWLLSELRSTKVNFS